MSLNPRQNRIKRELAKAKANTPPPLNPVFPFSVVPFDPWTFDLQNDPPAIDTPPQAAQ